jgi:hypothetical protein
MSRAFKASLMGAAVTLFANLATGHISVASGPAFANTTQEISFGVGHGCSGADTSSVRITIPAGVTSVRAVASDFGKASVEKDAAGIVTAVTWQKAPQDVLESDIAYYKLTLRLRVPNAPFTTLLFPARQTCTASGRRSHDGRLDCRNRIARRRRTGAGAGVASRAGAGPRLEQVHGAGCGERPRRFLRRCPDRVERRRRLQLENPNTSDLIGTTQGVTRLTALAANDEIWVKY